MDYTLLRGLMVLSGVLPRGGLLAFGRALGSAVWRTGLYRRGIVLDNLRHAFGAEMNESRLHDTAHAFFRNLGMTLMEFLTVPRLDRARLKELVEIKGLENLRKAAADGRGVLLVSGHFGNWEWFGARLAAEGLPVTVLGKSQSNQKVDRLLNGLRGRLGLHVIRAGGPLKEVVAALRRGDTVGMVADQDAGPDGCFVEFLGRPASFYRGVAHFSWKLQVPIVTGVIFRLPDGRHCVELGEPYSADPDWDEKTAIARLTELHAQRLAAAVRRSPEQYFWVHRRWKTRPPEARL